MLVRCSVSVAPWQASWLTPVSFIVSVPLGVTLWPFPGPKTLLTVTAGMLKSGLPPEIAVLQVECPASTVMLDRLTVPTRCEPEDGLSTVSETGEEEPG